MWMQRANVWMGYPNSRENNGENMRAKYECFLPLTGLNMNSSCFDDFTKYSDLMLFLYYMRVIKIFKEGH